MNCNVDGIAVVMLTLTPFEVARAVVLHRSALVVDGAVDGVVAGSADVFCDTVVFMYVVVDGGVDVAAVATHLSLFAQLVPACVVCVV
jgi:hypothetical protein